MTFAQCSRSTKTYGHHYYCVLVNEFGDCRGYEPGAPQWSLLQRVRPWFRRVLRMSDVTT